MRKITRMLAALIAIVIVFGTGLVLAAPEIADSAFKRVWDRQDYLIEQGLVKNRSWTWGPNVSPALEEELIQGLNGKRRVQYFEKSRMEINDPNIDPSSEWYVTNGLLPIEMMTGRMQVGYNFESENKVRGQARVAVIGDPGNFPTYADLLPLYQSPGTVNPNNVNRPVTTLWNADGSTSEFTNFSSDTLTTLLQGENGHGIVKAFTDFMNQEDFVYENGNSARAKVFNPVFVFGYPVTEPYWVKAKVGGKEVPILFQVFERRVLTYNPANELAFRVEMGNVGKHYYEWRYGTTQPTTPTTPTAPTPTPTTQPYPNP